MCGAHASIDPASIPNMAAKRLLEVESKFMFDPTLIPRLISNGGNPRFKRLEAVGTHMMTDTYYDHRDILSSNAIWLRRRQDGHSTILEAKVRVGGNYARSTFDEITDGAVIAKTVRPHVPGFNEAKENLGLDILARFTTTRQCFRADDKFSIMLDQMDFGHSIGEVELMAEDEAIAHQAIDGFMARYPWFFLKGKAEGKLEAYFRVKGAQ
ncbi:MAG: hypothetical protein Q9218_007433 [Villophora microphyllina]